MRDETQRTVRTRATQFRAGEGEAGERVIEGYFAVFDSNYELWPGATEDIAPGAFGGSLSGDVRALTNHDTTLVLGRNKAGTLELREDSRGLWGRVTINGEDSDAVNLYNRVKRGDVDQCSFGFQIGEEEVTFGEDGSVHFRITRVDPLYEVSVCTFPAYEETSVAARHADAENVKKRSLDAWRAEMLRKLKGE